MKQESRAPNAVQEPLEPGTDAIPIAMFNRSIAISMNAKMKTSNLQFMETSIDEDSSKHLEEFTLHPF